MVQTDGQRDVVSFVEGRLIRRKGDNGDVLVGNLNRRFGGGVAVKSRGDCRGLIAVELVVGERVEVEDRRRLTSGYDDGRGRFELGRVADRDDDGRVLFDGAAARNGRANRLVALVDVRLGDREEELAGERRLRGKPDVVVFVCFVLLCTCF